MDGRASGLECIDSVLAEMNQSSPDAVAHPTRQSEKGIPWKVTCPVTAAGSGSWRTAAQQSYRHIDLLFSLRRPRRRQSF